MYEKIIRAKLTFPKYVSKDARHLLVGLLDRSPKRRFGTLGAEEVKNHPFFQSINFVDLYDKKIPPPFKPKTTQGALDVTNVDEEFKSEFPQDTPVVPSTLKSKVDFSGFTYAGPDSELV